MSREIDEKIVEMRFDNRQFEAGVQTSMSTLDKLKRSLDLNGAAKGLDELSGAAKRYDMSALSRGVETVRLKFSAMEVVAVTALANIANSAVDAGRRVLSSMTVEPITTGFNEYELKMGSIQTIMASTGESLDRVNQKLDELNKYSDRTIYSFSDMTTNIGKFTNAGVKLDDAVAAIQGVSNVAAVSGASAAEASHAMYNFAQALSAGYVKLIDWKSIENANMATVEFKNQLLETAAAAGTLEKGAEGMYTVLTQNGQGSLLKEEIDATHMFNDSLAYQWLTTEVLTDTLKKYADETTEIGKKAYAAAQDVKTFTQLLDTLKESAQSGWAETWQLAVGDFEEAKDLLRNVSEFFSAIIDGAAQARNDLLRGALMSGWGQIKQEINNTGLSVDEFQNALREAASESIEGFDAMVEAAGSFDKTLSEGWLTADILSEALDRMANEATGTAEGLAALGDEQLKNAGFTQEQIAALRSLSGQAKDAGSALAGMLEKMERRSGRELLFDSLLNACKAIQKIFQAMKGAWDEIFPPMGWERLYEIIEGLERFSQWMILSDGSADKLKRSFKGLFAILDIGRQAFSALFRVLSPLFGDIDGLGDGILDITGSFGDWLVRVDEAIAEGDIFYRGLRKIADFLKSAAEAVREFGNTVVKYWRLLSLELEQLVEMLYSVLKTKLEELFQFLSYAKDRVIAIALQIREVLAEHISWSDIFTVGISIAMVAFVKRIGDILKLLAIPFNIIVQFVTSMAKAIGAFILRIKSEALVNIAKAILMLVGALTVLTLLDQAKLESAMLTLVLLASALTGIAFIVSHMGDVKDVAKISVSLLSIGGAVALLAAAMKSLSALDTGDIAKGLITVTALAGVLIASVKLLSTKKERFFASVATMLGFAASLKLFVSAIQDISDMQVKDPGKVFGVLTGAVTAFWLLSAACKKISFGAGVGILAAVAAMKIAVGAFKDLSEADSEGLKRGLKALAAAFGMFSLVALAARDSSYVFGDHRNAGNNIKAVSSAILKMSAALMLIVASFKMMEKIDPETMKRATGTVAALFGVFAAITAASHFAGENAGKAGTMVLAMSGAIVLLSAAMALLAHLDPTGLGRALGTVTALLGVFAVLVGVSSLAGKAAEAKATLIVLTVSIAALIAAVGALSLLDPARLKNTALSLSALIAALGAAVAGTHFAGGFKKSAGTLLLLTGVVAALGGILLALDRLEVEASIKTAGSLALLLTSMSAAMALLGKAGDVAGTAIVKLGAIGLVVTGLAVILGKMNGMGVEASLQTAFSLSVLLNAMSAAMVVLSKAGTVSKSAIGALALTGVITAGLAFLLGWLNSVGMEVSLSIETAASLSMLLLAMSGACVILGAAGKFGKAAFAGVGVLAALIVVMGGIMTGISALTKDNPTVEADLDRAIAVLEKLGTGLGAFFGGAIGGLLGGTTSALPMLGRNLSSFMLQALPFFVGVKAIGGDVLAGVKNLAEAFLIFTGADVLEVLKSVVLPEWLVGGSSLANFAAQLKPLGTALQEFAGEVKGLGTEDIEAAAAAAKMLAGLAIEIPNNGSTVLKWLLGEKNLETFGSQLEPLAEGLKTFATKTQGITEANVEGAVSAAKMLAGLAVEIPNNGSTVLKWLLGEKSLETFGSQLEPLAEGLKTFATKTQGIGPSDVESAVSAAEMLVGLANGLEGVGVLDKLFGGGQTLDGFGAQLSSFGGFFKSFYDSLSGVNFARIDGAVENFNSLIAFAHDAQSIPANATAAFRTALGSLALSGIGEFVDAFSDTSPATNAMEAFIFSMATAITDHTLPIRSAATTLMGAFADAVYKSGTAVRTNVNAVIDSAASGAQGSVARFVTLGQNAGKGFIRGVSSMLRDAYIAGHQLGSSAESGAADALDSHSPSREFERLGIFAGKGLGIGLKEGSGFAADGVTDLIGDVIDAAESVGDKIDDTVGFDLTGVLGLDDYVEKGKELLGTAESVMDGVASIREQGQKDALSDLDKLERGYQGAAQSQTEAVREAYEIQNGIVDEAFQAKLDWIEEEKYYSRLSLEEELAIYEQFQQTYLEGTEERKRADREAYRVRNEIAAASYQASINWIEREEHYDRLGLADKLAAYRRLRDRETLSAEDREKAAREVYSLEKEIYEAEQKYIADIQAARKKASQKRDELEEEFAEKEKSIREQLARDIESENNRYLSALESRVDSLYSAYGLFDEVAEREEVSGDTLMGNLEDQVKEFSEWRDTLDALSARGLDEELISELSAMGPSAISQIKALESMSDTELNKYVALWSVKHGMARAQAVSELEGLRQETLDNISTLRSEADRELEEYRVIWQQRMGQVNTDCEEELDALRKEFEKTVGLIREYTEEELAEMADVANQILRDAGWYETGEMIVEGIAEGIRENAHLFVDAITDMTSAGTEGAEEDLDEHSPSREFYRIGRYAALGLVNSLHDYTGRVYGAGAEVAGAAKKGLGDVISGIADMIDSGIEIQPAITPVVDFSDITRASEAMDELFYTQRSVTLAGQVSGLLGAAGTGERDLNVTVDNAGVVRELRSLRGEMAEMTERMRHLQVVLDSGTLVGELAEPMDQALGQRISYRERGI